MSISLSYFFFAKVFCREKPGEMEVIELLLKNGISIGYAH